MKKVVYLLLGTLLCGCASSQVSVLVDDFAPQDKRLVLLSGERVLKPLRVELIKRGFKVPRYASTVTSITEEKQTAEGKISVQKTFNATEASYGLEVSDLQVLEKCDFSSALKYRLTVEVVDLAQNEVVAYVSQKGWERDCFLSGKGNLYKELAKQINSLWKGKFAADELYVDDEEDEEPLATGGRAPRIPAAARKSRI